MPLLGIGLDDISLAGAQLHVCNLQPVQDATEHDGFLAPVELEGFT